MQKGILLPVIRSTSFPENGEYAFSYFFNFFSIFIPFYCVSIGLRYFLLVLRYHDFLINNYFVVCLVVLHFYVTTLSFKSTMSSIILSVFNYCLSRCSSLYILKFACQTDISEFTCRAESGVHPFGRLHRKRATEVARVSTTCHPMTKVVIA